MSPVPFSPSPVQHLSIAELVHRDIMNTRTYMSLAALRVQCAYRAYRIRVNLNQIATAAVAQSRLFRKSFHIPAGVNAASDELDDPSWKEAQDVGVAPAASSGDVGAGRAPSQRLLNGVQQQRASGVDDECVVRNLDSPRGGAGGDGSGAVDGVGAVDHRHSPVSVSATATVGRAAPSRSPSRYASLRVRSGSGGSAGPLSVPGQVGGEEEVDAGPASDRLDEL